MAEPSPSSTESLTLDRPPESAESRSTPIIARKKSAFEMPDVPGLWRVHWQIDQTTLLSTFYTRHDQACLLWGLVSGCIFIAVQFLTVSWFTQAIASSVLTLLGLVGMVSLTRYLTVVGRLAWIFYSWAALMLIGTIVTDLSVFLGWGYVLVQLCPLWLGLCAVGHLITGIGMRSRTFVLLSIVHLLAIILLPYVGVWKPLTTGIVISGSVLLMAELQWDSDGVCGHVLELERQSQKANSQISAPVQTAPELPTEQQLLSIGQ